MRLAVTSLLALGLLTGALRAEPVDLELVFAADGPNMNGRPLAAARAEALAKGFTINALSIRRPGGRPGGPGGMALEDYYAQNVIGGPGAFVEIADEMRPFAVAARRKLLTEVAGHEPRVRFTER